MARNKTIKKNYIRPKLYKSRSNTRHKPKLYKSKSRTRSNKKNKNNNFSRSRSNSRLSRYDYGFSFRGGKKLKGGMDKEQDGSVFRFPKKTETQKVFEQDNQTGNFRKPGRFYGINYQMQGFCSHRFYPKPENARLMGKYDEVVEEFHAKTNRKFFSPYTKVCIGNWRGTTNHYAKSFDPHPDRGDVSHKSEELVGNIKNLDMEINKVLSSIITNTETVNNENLKTAIKLINEKNENITDLQIHRLREGYGNYGHTTHTEKFMMMKAAKGEYVHNADYILHRYVIQCIIRLRFPKFDYPEMYREEYNMKDFEISDEEKDALESIKNETTDTYSEESKIELFGKIKDMPIIPIEFAWLLDKRIVNEKFKYKLFGSWGIFEILLPSLSAEEKDKKLKARDSDKIELEILERKGTKDLTDMDSEDLRKLRKKCSIDEKEKEEEKLDPTLLSFNFDLNIKYNRYMFRTTYIVFKKIWTANVIAKYIFKIYHDTSFTYIKGDTYPTIGECMSKMDITQDYNIKEEQLKIIKEDAKQRTILDADEPNVTSDIQEQSPISQKPYEVNKLEGAMTNPFEITEENPFSEKPIEEKVEEEVGSRRRRKKPKRNDYKGPGNSLEYIVDPKEYDGENPNESLSRFPNFYYKLENEEGYDPRLQSYSITS